MNFLKNIQKLVVGEFFEDQVIKEQYDGLEGTTSIPNSQSTSSSSIFDCCGNIKHFLNYNNQSSSGNSNLQPKKYTINNVQIQEDKLLSEGGYGYVWRAHNAQNKSEVFAVKRMICQGQQKQDLARRELEILYKLPQHENLVKFIDGDIFKEDANTSQAVFLFEYCPDGTLFKLMESRYKSEGLSESEIVHITLQICKGLEVLHSINMTHRDVKIENVLIKDGKFKLCDFGSASTDIIDLSKLDRKQLDEQEELYERYTTLQSRPPEMCDVYSGEMVDQRVDVWMLGCIVYCMCFFIHPFYESSKLAIISASYKFKQNSKFNEKMHDFIRHLLTPSPKFRPKINEVIQILENWNNIKQINLNEQAKATKESEIQFEEEMKQRDEKVKQLIEKNRQQRVEEEKQKKQQEQAQRNQYNNNQQQIQTQQQQQQINKAGQQLQNKSKSRDMDDFDGWGDFQKADDNSFQNETNNQKVQADEIDFNSFQPSGQTQNVYKDNFDFGEFYEQN